jgi:hypothetical protein
MSRKKPSLPVQGEIPKCPYHLLISVDPELLNCAFVWVHHGELPVLYPLASFQHAIGRWTTEEFDNSQGLVSFPVPACSIVKLDFFPEGIIAFVQEWLEKVRAENPSATREDKTNA